MKKFRTCLLYSKKKTVLVLSALQYIKKTKQNILLIYCANFCINIVKIITVFENHLACSGLKWQQILSGFSAGSVIKNSGFMNCNWSEEHEHICVTNFILLWIMGPYFEGRT